MLRLAFFLVGVLTVASIVAYALFGVQWWSATKPNDWASNGGEGRGMLIMLVHLAGLSCLIGSVAMPPDTK